MLLCFIFGTKVYIGSMYHHLLIICEWDVARQKQGLSSQSLPILLPKQISLFPLYNINIFQQNVHKVCNFRASWLYCYLITHLFEMLDSVHDICKVVQILVHCINISNEGLQTGLDTLVSDPEFWETLSVSVAMLTPCEIQIRGSQ